MDFKVYSESLEFYLVQNSVGKLWSSLNTVKFCGLSQIQLPNNSGSVPGTGRGTAREIFVD